MTAQLQVIAFGEGSGHPFHGNQHTGGLGSAERTPSLRQSEERIREALPNAKVDLEWHFEKFGMRVSDVPPVPMDRKLADITAGRIEKFAAEFPESAATIAGVNMAEGASGYAQTNFATLDGDPVISLNPDFYPSEKTLQDGLTDPSWVGVAVATPEGVIDHELGHVLDFSRDADYVDRLRGPGYYSGRTETFNERSNMGKISEYAAQGGGPEAFAEAFALHQSGADIPVAKAERAIDSAVNEAHQSHSNDHAPAVAASGMVGGHTCEGFGPPPKTKRADLGEGAGHPFRGNQYSGGSGRGEGSGREQKMKAAEDRISKVIGGNLGPTAGAVPPDKRVDLTLMDQKLATEVADRVEVFAKEFPAAADRIGAVVTAPLEEGVRAETRVSPEGDLGILLNRDDYQDATTLRDVLGSPLNSTATFDTQGVIDHELGHVLDVMAPQNGSLGADTFWSDSQMENVSDYASTDPQEAVAEAFAVRQEGADAETVLPTAVERQITAAVDEVKTHPGEDRKEQASVFGSAFADWKPVCSGYPGKRITSYAAVQPLSFGESAGHPFRGNQYTSGLSDNVDSSWRDVHPFSKEQQNWLREREQFYRDNDMLAPSNVAAGFHQHEDSDEAMRMRSAFYDQLGIPRTMDEHVDQFTRYDNKDVIAADREPTRAENDLAEEWLIHRDDAQYEHPNVGDQQVSVYRGGYSEQARSEPTGTVTELPINVLSSWTTDPATARDFGPVYKAQVDMKDVFHADPPHAGESEVIVYTGDLTRQAVRVDSPERGTRSGGPSMAASAEFGDAAGHPFRGNQYRGGEGGATVTNGVAWMTSQKTPEEKAAFHERLGNCYPLSGQYVTSHPDATLVHGTIQGMGFPPNPHAWVENADGTVHEPASDRNWTPEAFKDYFHPVVNDRYSSHDAARMMVGTGHYGPWTDQERKTAEFGEGAGHPFRGNQWKDIGSHAEVKAAKHRVLESMRYALGPGDRMTHEINSLPSRMNAMWRTPQETVLQSRGHSPESIKEADSLIHQHSGNSQSQDQADAAISRAFNDPNSEVGAVLRDRAELESQVHDAYRQGIAEWANAQRDAINAADWSGQGPTMDHSIPVETWTEHPVWTSPGPDFDVYYGGEKDNALRRVDVEATDADMYYRQAGSEGRKDVEAWTINPEGADTMAATNPGENLITPDTHATYDQLNDQGYRLLVQQTGIAGAPGEGEALWVKDKRSVVAAVQPLEMGEHAGHPFRGNQWTDIGHGGVETRAIHYVEQLYNGEKVSIPADQVATVLDVIGRQAADAKAAGREARDINLCNASVEGANMFCSDSFGIPRQDMAQLAGDVVPGSQAALDNPGEKNIDATDKFLDSLREQGVPFTKDVVPAQELKATQDELSGAKVAGIMNADMLDQERLFREPLVVSKENYILDGHHRWAAGIGLEYMDGKLDSDVTANVYRVDAPITELMTDAKSFATSYGIKSEGIKSFTKGGNFSVIQPLVFGEGAGHAFRGNQHTGGIGGEHDQLPLCPPSCHERELAVLHRDNLAIDGKFGDGMRPTNLQFEHTPERMGQWAPEREKVHNEIVANALRSAEERGVPQDSQMVLMGGLPGAGKSSATEDILDPKDWLVISPDDVKLQLAERGDIPTPDGMKAMEASPLVGDEAMKVSWDLADQATAQGYNVVWDMTGDDASWYSERIQNAQSTLPESEPYKTTGIFVDVPIEQSKDQVSSRYAKGAESTYGGRPVPQDYIERSRDPQYGSTQRRAFEEARDAGLLGQVMVIDNTDHKQQVVEKTPGFTLD